MTASGPSPEVGSTHEAAEIVDAYFARLRAALIAAKVDGCGEVLDDLRSHVVERLAECAASTEDVVRALAELGEPEAVAAGYADATREPGHGASSKAHAGPRPVPLSGTLLGMPYDVRVPTVERVAQRWWDPLEPRILVPRIFGLGWTINFAAVAVRLGLIRPDDEEVPFGMVPRGYLAVALALPLAIAVAFAVLVLVYEPHLPTLVPAHWGLTGAPDEFWPKGYALALPALLTLAGLAMALWSWIRKRSPALRVAAGAAATALATLSLGIYAQTIAYAGGDRGMGVLLAGIVLALVLPFALLVALSRIGRAREMRRDLSR
jgi:hypothetical protein